MKRVGETSPLARTNEQVVRQRHGLSPENEPAPEQPAGVSEAKLKDRAQHALLEERRLQGQAPQLALPVLPPDHVDIPPEDFALLPPETGFLVGGVLASVFGSTTGLLAIGMAFGGATDAALSLGAVSLPLLAIAFYCWRNFG